MYTLVHINLHPEIPPDRQLSGKDYQDKNYEISLRTRHILLHLISQMANISKQHTGIQNGFLGTAYQHRNLD